MLRHPEGVPAKACFVNSFPPPNQGGFDGPLCPIIDYLLPPAYKQGNNTDTVIHSFDCQGDTL